MVTNHVSIIGINKPKYIKYRTLNFRGLMLVGLTNSSVPLHFRWLKKYLINLISLKELSGQHNLLD